MNPTLLKEHFELDEAIARLASQAPVNADINLVCRALERRLKVEKRIRKYNRKYHQKRRVLLRRKGNHKE